jgi:hypothetical protein
MKVVELLLWNTDRYAHRKTFETVHRILRVTGSFTCENADREQQRRAEGDSLDAMQRSPSTVIPRLKSEPANEFFG